MTNMTGWIHTRFLATWTNTEPFGRRNAQAIYQDLVDQHGFTASYESVKRFVRALRTSIRNNSTVSNAPLAKKRRWTTAKAPGSEIQAN